MRHHLDSPQARPGDATRPGRQLRRRLDTTPRWAKWGAAWLGAAVLGMVNGAARDLVYADAVGDLAAHQISTATLIVALGAYMTALQRRWPLQTARTAFGVGIGWVAATVTFEFGLGRAQGKPWSELFADYDLVAGRVWVLVLLAMAVGPATVRRLSAVR
jgi:hypothetical protein